MEGGGARPKVRREAAADKSLMRGPPRSGVTPVSPSPPTANRVTHQDPAIQESPEQPEARNPDSDRGWEMFSNKVKTFSPFHDGVTPIANAHAGPSLGKIFQVVSPNSGMDLADTARVVRSSHGRLSLGHGELQEEIHPELEVKGSPPGATIHLSTVQSARIGEQEPSG